MSAAPGPRRWIVLNPEADGSAPERPLDVAVVGGGVSGLFAAWRLTQCLPGDSAMIDELTGGERRRPQVAVYEMGAQVGGRLLSLRPPGVGDVIVDLGAFRYRASQRRITRLVEDDLALAWRPQPVDAGNVVHPRPPAATLRAGPAGEEAEPVTEAIRRGITAAVGCHPGQGNDRDWYPLARSTSRRGRPLTDWGWYELLEDLLAPASFAAAVAPFGYGRLLGDWNAADAIAWYADDLQAGEDFRRPVGGMQEIAHSLAGQIWAAGGDIHCATELVGLTPLDRALVKLEFRNWHRCAPGPRRRYARHVLLALPRRALERLADRGTAPWLASSTMRHLVSAVANVAMMTIVCCYDQPWWSAIADVPQSCADACSSCLGQALWIGTLGSGGVGGGADAVLTIYNGEGVIGPWRALGPTGSILEDRDSVPRWEDYLATSALGAEVHRQLRRAYGVPDGQAWPAPPTSVACRDWTEEPFGGECHAWRVHRRSDETRRCLARPDPAVPVYVCGEAYSTHQGWVEGALQSTDAVLETVFGLRAYDAADGPGIRGA